ncbi:MFS transporter [Streptomyces sp. NPDC006430]|uniref:MFS transporter n=1 Tax=Streptomyces sp. NPDC006430 TaxID=3154299 RepID=UPI0033B2F45A
MSRAQAPRETSREAGPLRRNRDFLLLWSGAGIAFLGSRVGAIAYPLVAIKLTGSPSSAGVVAFASTLSMVMHLPAGVLVDRFDRRRMMIACDAGRTLAVVSMVTALLTGTGSIPHLAAVAFVEGSLTTFYRIAERAAVPNLVPPEQLTLAMSRNEARERSGGLLGQPVGGALFGLAAWLPFVGSTASYLMSLGTLLCIRKGLQDNSVRKDERLTREIAEGFAWMWRHAFVRVTTLLIAGSNTLFQVLTLSLIVLIEGDGGSSTVVGLVLAATGVGGIAGALSASWCTERLRMPVIVLATNWIWAPLVILIAFVHEPLLLALISAVSGFVGALWSVAVSAYQLRITPDAIQGRVLSAQLLCGFLPVPLGALAGGWLLESRGVHTTVLILGAGMTLLAVASVVSPAMRQALASDETGSRPGLRRPEE